MPFTIFSFHLIISPPSRLFFIFSRFSCLLHYFLTRCLLFSCCHARSFDVPTLDIDYDIALRALSAITDATPLPRCAIILRHIDERAPAKRQSDAVYARRRYCATRPRYASCGAQSGNTLRTRPTVPAAAYARVLRAYVRNNDASRRRAQESNGGKDASA